MNHPPRTSSIPPSLNRRILRQIASSLGGNNLDLIDTTDYRDITDFIMLPDPSEEPEFAPLYTREN